MQLSIGGMTCGSCSAAVQSALDRMPGVTAASVALLSSSAEVRHISTIFILTGFIAINKACADMLLAMQVTFRSQETQTRAICDAIEELGFNAGVKETTRASKDRNVARMQVNACSVSSRHMHELAH